MTAKQYQPIYHYFSQHPRLKRAVCLTTKLLPFLPILLYPFLLLLWIVRLWNAFQCGADITLPLCELLRAILVPGGVFVGGSLFRHWFNASRPYEQPNFVPLMEKNTKGHSFPSRHALSASVIAAAWLRTYPPVGFFLLFLTVLIALSRVIVGVHYIRDVLAGVCLGLGIGLLGMFFPF